VGKVFRPNGPEWDPNVTSTTGAEKDLNVNLLFLFP
jgi:hypothetical protein